MTPEQATEPGTPTESVAEKPAPAADATEQPEARRPSLESTERGECREVEVFACERMRPVMGWSAGYLLPTDRYASAPGGGRPPGEAPDVFGCFQRQLAGCAYSTHYSACLG